MSPVTAVRYDEAPKPGTDILALVSRQLANHRGVFLGEQHDQFLARDFLISHMDALRKAGVTTIYFETRDPLVKATKTHGTACIMAQDLDRLAIKNPEIAKQIEDVKRTGAEALFAKVEPDQIVRNRTFMEQLVRIAHASGIEVIGHDTIGDAFYQLPARDALKYIDQRDINSAHIVNSSAPKAPLDKFIILAGSDHSRGAASYTMPDRSSITLSEGLPERLDIPSIDFTTFENLTMHESLLPERENLAMTLERKPYTFRTLNDTSADFAVVHRSGAALLAEGHHQLPEGYNVAFALFNEPDCRYHVEDENAILPPASIENIIRNIHAGRRR